PVSPATATVTYCDVQGGWMGTGNINADPLFMNAGNGDLRLQSGSRCIDGGNNDAVPGGMTTDIDGNPRFVDDPSTPDTGHGTPPIVDMGAYEYPDLPFHPGDLNCDRSVDAADVGAFVLALLDPAGYRATYPSCDINNADLNRDGSVDGLDVQP